MAADDLWLLQLLKAAIMEAQEKGRAFQQKLGGQMANVERFAGL